MKNIIILAALVVMAHCVFGRVWSGGDHFADDLKIPEGIDIAVPGKDVYPHWGTNEGSDAFSRAVLAALETKGGTNTVVKAELGALQKLA
ncbi:MAG: hypothetical protein II863_04640, partial [Kiritimatiellae bacterium]|nr:hypothetical protein [Kiritimatiellia bacterium]